MQNREEVNMDIVVEDLPSFLKSFSTLQNLYQLELHLADETERLALKAALDNAVTQLVQSHVKTVGDQSSASALNFEKQQEDGVMENQVTSIKAKLCSNCGKIKKLKTAAAVVMTELDVIQRFKAAGHIGDDKVFPRKEMKNRVRALYSASTGSQTQPTNSRGSYTSSDELDSPPRRAMQLDHYRINGSLSPSRTPQTHYSHSTSSSTSYSSSQEEDYPSRRRIRYSKANPPRSTSSSTSYSSSQEEDYPVRRRNRYSKADPPQKKAGHVRSFMNKIAGMFHHDRREDTDASSSEDSNSRDHHHSVEKPVGNERHQTVLRTVLVASTCPDGAFLGSIISGSISDAVGHRRGFQLSALPMIFGFFLSSRMESLEGMLLGRFLVGTGIGVGPSVASLYVTEICFPLIHVAPRWRVFLGICMSCSILALAMVSCGESPKWLHKKGRSAEAEAEFEKLLGGLHVKSAMADLSKSEEMSQTCKVFGVILSLPIQSCIRSITEYKARPRLLSLFQFFVFRNCRCWCCLEVLLDTCHWSGST
ncbi:hypothetical protein MKX03_002440 [Papaver bracteatum]|nr:hypothetical protein MKX03_002440 [Papaver bracteatum]